MKKNIKLIVTAFACAGLLAACAAPSLNDADRALLNQALDAGKAANASATKAEASAKRAEAAADRAEAAATRAEDAAAQAERSAEKAEKAFEMTLHK